MRSTVGKSWKLLVAAAAALGIAGFFVPFFQWKIDGRGVPTSAYRILFGFDRLEGLDSAPLDGERGTPSAQLQVSADSVEGLNDLIQHEAPMPNDQDVLMQFVHRSFVPYYFLSSIALAGLALLALARRDLTWIGGLVAIAAAMGALFGWSREAVFDRHSLFTSTRLGATLLGTSGLLALIAGVGVFLIPDPGGPLRRARIALARARLIKG